MSDTKLQAEFEDVYLVECFGPDGKLKWRDTIVNTVVNTGLNDALDKYFNGSSYTAAHYCGLTDGTPNVVPGDTIASHSGWSEVTGYSQGARPTIVWGSVASQSINNGSNKSVFSINATVTVGGAFVVTNATKGGSSGILYGGGAFTGGDKSLTSGDTLNVQITASAAAS